MSEPWQAGLDRLAEEYLHGDGLCARPTQVETMQLLMLQEIRDILRRLESLMTVP